MQTRLQLAAIGPLAAMCFAGPGCRPPAPEPPPLPLRSSADRATALRIAREFLEIAGRDFPPEEPVARPAWSPIDRQVWEVTWSGAIRIRRAVANGMFGARERQSEPPYAARLAWAVYFGDEAVWIDAGSGSVLGGILLK